MLLKLMRAPFPVSLMQLKCPLLANIFQMQLEDIVVALYFGSVMSVQSPTENYSFGKKNETLATYSRPT